MSGYNDFNERFDLPKIVDTSEALAKHFGSVRHIHALDSYTGEGHSAMNKVLHGMDLNDYGDDEYHAEKLPSLLRGLHDLSTSKPLERPLLTYHGINRGKRINTIRLSAQHEGDQFVLKGLTSSSLDGRVAGNFAGTFFDNSDRRGMPLEKHILTLVHPAGSTAGIYIGHQYTGEFEHISKPGTIIQSMGRTITTPRGTTQVLSNHPNHPNYESDRAGVTGATHNVPVIHHNHFFKVVDQ